MRLLASCLNCFIIVRREVGCGHIGALGETYPAITQVIPQVIFIGIGTAALEYPAFLPVDKLDGTGYILDAVHIVTRLRASELAASINPRGIIP